jgi:uncharacterized secreted repeat protein (TIGR03808 family)
VVIVRPERFFMTVDRRSILAAGLGLAAGTSAVAAGPRAPDADIGSAPVEERDFPGPRLEPNTSEDQTEALQAAIDLSASRGAPLLLLPGHFRVGRLELRPGTRIIGAYGKTTLEFAGGASFITARDADGAGLEGLVLDGGLLPLDPGKADGLVAAVNCKSLLIRNIEVRRSLLNGISLHRCAGRVTDSTITHVSQAGILSRDAAGLEIAHNVVSDCGNNGIQVWREKDGEDGTIVAANRIERIEARAGGTGENGNGVNVFRAGGVLVSGNRISECAYSAIRANAASNVQMVANSCAKLGEVALYAEFGFEGALIASNLVDGAASGIAVTNFNDGGRLAIVQGNLIRNLVRREAEPVDKRGDGISVEADAVVSANVVENAPGAGIVVGWGKYMRDVAVTQNLIRGARIGIMVTSDREAGSCLIAQNMISGAKEGAIRAMTLGMPVGTDLAIDAPAGTRVSVAGNLAV